MVNLTLLVIIASGCHWGVPLHCKSPPNLVQDLSSVVFPKVSKACQQIYSH